MLASALWLPFRVSFSLHVRIPKHILHWLYLDVFLMAFRAARLQVTHRLEWLSWGVLHLFLCESSFLHEMLPASVPGPKHAPALGLRVAVSFMMFGAFKGAVQ